MSIDSKWAAYAGTYRFNGFSRASWREMVYGCVASTLLGLLPMVGHAQSAPDPVSISTAEVEAANRGDIPARLALVTDDYVQDGGDCMAEPGGRCVGKAAYQQHLLASKGGPQVKRTIIDQKINGNVVVERAELRFTPNILAAAGVDRLIAISRAELRGDKIASLKIVSDLSDDATARASVGPGAASLPTARDGQTLVTQSSATRQAFVAV